MQLQDFQDVPEFLTAGVGILKRPYSTAKGSHLSCILNSGSGRLRGQ